MLVAFKVGPIGLKQCLLVRNNLFIYKYQHLFIYKYQTMAEKGNWFFTSII